MTTNDVAPPSRAHQTMGENWPLVRALLGGTRTMRAAGEEFLPRIPRNGRKTIRSA